MKMKFFAALAAVMMTVSASSQLKDGKYIVDYKGSSITWSAQKVTGSGHTGTVRVSSGNVVVTKNAISSAKVNVDVNALAVTDIPAGEMNSNLVNHLKSPDFFDAAAHPDAKFEITSVKEAKDKEGNTHSVTGKLTIKGITQDVTFPAKVSSNGSSITIAGSMTFDRSKFEIRYGSTSFFNDLGDKAINNDVKLTFNLIANV
jgi:polyisoprenoid-binding protein YceI